MAKTKPKKQLSSSAAQFRVTLAGWLFLVVAVLVGLASVRTQGPMLYVLFGVMLGALHVSALISVRMLRNLELRRKSPTHVWQNQVVPNAYFLTNKGKGWSLALTVDEQAAPGAVSATAGYCASLQPLATFRAGTRMVATRRGRFALGSVTVTTLFPFGLIEARRRFMRGASLVVWPARGRLKSQLLRRGAVETSAAAPSRSTGGQDEFFGLREYRPDDNPRWIHWRRSATSLMAGGAPVVREMARPLPEVLFVILDTQVEKEEFTTEGTEDAGRKKQAPGNAGAGRSSTKQSAAGNPQSPTLEHMLRFAATLIDHAIARGYEVGLAMAAPTPKPPAAEGRKAKKAAPTEAGTQSAATSASGAPSAAAVVHSPAAGAAQLTAMLDSLADVDAFPSTPLQHVLAQLRPAQIRHAQVVLVTPDAARLRQVGISSVKARCRHLTVLTTQRLADVFIDAQQQAEERGEKEERRGKKEAEKEKEGDGAPTDSSSLSSLSPSPPLPSSSGGNHAS